MNNLLIGNGLNLTNRTENAFLETRNIYYRFKRYLKDYWAIIKELVHIEDIKLHKLLDALSCKCDCVGRLV